MRYETPTIEVIRFQHQVMSALTPSSTTIAPESSLVRETETAPEFDPFV